MRWPFRKSNASLAGQVPEGGLRRFLCAPAPRRDTPLTELPLLALDLETTGLDPSTDHIISVGMVDVDGLRIPLGTMEHFLIDPGRGVGQSAVIHMLTDDELLAHGIPTEQALDRVFSRLAGKVLLAHHDAIEVGFLTVAVKRIYGIRIAIPSIDTLQLGHRAIGRGIDHPPDALRLWRLRARAGLPSYRGHDAVIDALGCAELYLALVQELRLGDLRSAR